jgi:arylsulfatase
MRSSQLGPTPWRNGTHSRRRRKNSSFGKADVYAAYLAYTDYEIGRVVQAVQDIGKLDNTLIIYISGDNGASPEGTPNGIYNEYTILNGVHPTVAENMKFYDVWGTDQTYPHYAVAWAWAFDTPYQWTKEVASHISGAPAMAWPWHGPPASNMQAASAISSTM